MATRPVRAILFRKMVVGTHTKRRTPRLRSRRYAIEGLGPGRHLFSSPPITSAAPGPSSEALAVRVEPESG